MAPVEVAHPLAPFDQRADIHCSCGLCDKDEPSEI
jgi:hypothetical protein